MSTQPPRSEEPVGRSCFIHGDSCVRSGIVCPNCSAFICVEAVLNMMSHHISSASVAQDPPCPCCAAALPSNLPLYARDQVLTLIDVEANRRVDAAMRAIQVREAQERLSALPESAVHKAKAQELKLVIEELLVERCPFCGVTAPLPGDWNGCMMIKCGVVQNSRARSASRSCFHTQGEHYCGCCCQPESSPLCVGGLPHFNGGLMPITSHWSEVWNRRLMLRQGKLDAFLRDNVNSQELFDALVVAMQRSPALTDPTWPRSLRLQWSQGLIYQAQNPRTLSDAMLRAAVARRRQLQRLDVQGCDLLTDASMRKVATHCRQLQHLNVEGCDQLTDASMRAVAARCPQLHHLNVSWCIRLTDASMRAVAARCPQLHHLNVSRCDRLSDMSLLAVATRCPQLQHLNVSGGNRLCDASMRAVAALCPQLQHLNVSRCDRLSDMSLLAVATRCRQLQHLNVSWCIQLSDTSMCALADHCRQLQHLNVSSCDQLTDASMLKVAEHCQQLQHLDVEGCDLLTDASMREVATHCGQLQHLNVSWCIQLTDASMCALADHCRQLQHLNVSWCNRLTNASMRAVAAHCPQLQHLNVKGCIWLTDRPQLQHLNVVPA